MWFVYLLIYLFVGAGLTTVVINLSGEDLKDPGLMTFLTIAWPIVLPILAGYKLASLLFPRKKKK